MWCLHGFCIAQVLLSGAYRLRITGRLSPGGTDIRCELIYLRRADLPDGTGKSAICRMGLSHFVCVIFLLTLMGIPIPAPVPGFYSLLSCLLHAVVNLQIL